MNPRRSKRPDLERWESLQCGKGEEYIQFGKCCNDSDDLCCCSGGATGWPVFWPPKPKCVPQIVCRDCGCRFEMKPDDHCFRPRTPDFSDLRHYGYELDISEPNACNEIYFNFIPCRCLPPQVCCTCPLCRRRMRPGDHFCDCTCILCISRREKCLNRIRRELLAEHGKHCSGCGKTKAKLPRCCAPLPNPYSCGKENEVPREPHARCPCHMFPPSYWIVVKACPERKTYEKEVKKEEKEYEEKLKKEREEQNEGIWKFLTKSMSQTIWGNGECPHLPCPSGSEKEETTEEDTNEEDSDPTHSSSSQPETSQPKKDSTKPALSPAQQSKQPKAPKSDSSDESEIKSKRGDSDISDNSGSEKKQSENDTSGTATSSDEKEGPPPGCLTRLKSLISKKGTPAAPQDSPEKQKGRSSSKTENPQESQSTSASPAPPPQSSNDPNGEIQSQPSQVQTQRPPRDKEENRTSVSKEKASPNRKGSKKPMTSAKNRSKRAISAPS